MSTTSDTVLTMHLLFCDEGNFHTVTVRMPAAEARRLAEECAADTVSTAAGVYTGVNGEPILVRFRHLALLSPAQPHEQLPGSVSL